MARAAPAGALSWPEVLPANNSGASLAVYPVTEVSRGAPLRAHRYSHPLPGIRRWAESAIVHHRASPSDPSVFDSQRRGQLAMSVSLVEQKPRLCFQRLHGIRAGRKTDRRRLLSCQLD